MQSWICNVVFFSCDSTIFILLPPYQFFSYTCRLINGEDTGGRKSEFSLILLNLSTLFMFVTLVLNVFLARSTHASNVLLWRTIFRVITRRHNASIFLLQVFPLFAMIYFLGFLEYIDKERVLIGFLGMMFSVWIMDAHHDILDTNTYVRFACWTKS